MKVILMMSWSEGRFWWRMSVMITSQIFRDEVMVDSGVKQRGGGTSDRLHILFIIGRYSTSWW